MYDNILKIDLEQFKDLKKYELSFVIFPDGRTVKCDGGSHASTVVEYSRKFYPEIENKFKDFLNKQLESWTDDDIDEETKEYYSSMIVLNGEYISRKLGIVLIHNNEFLFSDVNLTKKQEYALDKLDKLFDFVWL